MTKTIKLEVEVTLDESVEQRAIQVARTYYSEVGQATVPLDDKGEHWREVAAEEIIPDALSAVMELIGANDLLEKAGVKVTAVSGRESPARRITPARDTRDGAPGGQMPAMHGCSEADLDAFETGVYLCRWPNGDFSLVAANTRREALVELDEWDAAHPCQLFPLESCMVDFRLNDQGEIELKQFGEDTEELIWEISYPKLHAQSIARDADGRR